MSANKARVLGLTSLWLACATFTSLLSVSVIAQTVTGTLQGTVTDMNGAVVPGAEITIHNADTGQERALKTNSDGFYLSPLLPLGRYNVTVSQKGFTKAEKQDIEISLNQTRVVDFTLNPIGVSEAVLVTGEAAAINTTNQQIAQGLTMRLAGVLLVGCTEPDVAVDDDECRRIVAMLERLKRAHQLLSVIGAADLSYCPTVSTKPC